MRYWKVAVYCVAALALLGTVLGSDDMRDHKSIIILVSDKQEPLPETPYGDSLLADERVILVDSWPEMKSTFTDTICGIVITRNAINNEPVDWAWIHGLYESGVGVGTIGMTNSELADFLRGSLSPNEGQNRAYNAIKYLVDEDGYTPDRWPIAYFVERKTLQGGYGGFGSDALYHPDYGWQSIERLLGQIDCI